MPYVARAAQTHFRALLVVRVHDVRQEPALAVPQLRLALELLDRALVHHARRVHDVTADGRLARVHMADEHHVDVLTRVLLRDQLVEGQRSRLGTEARSSRVQWMAPFRWPLPGNPHRGIPPQGKWRPHSRSSPIWASPKKIAR